MYLADVDIRALLPELRLEAPNPEHPFDPDEQVQPCSIDLRVADVFWKPSRRHRYWHRLTPGRGPVVDLRRTKMHELDPRRDWKRIDLTEGETLTIRPRQILMARVYERLQVPPAFAGKIEGRSSFARLGLFVHCSGDFVNPGWDGYMPLQLFNAGPYPIRLTPYVPICQLKLVRLSSVAARPYGTEDLQSKYVNDDGGPSFWWRDREIAKLQSRLGGINVTERMQRDIIERVRFENADILERFERFVRARRIASVENASELLDAFSAKETWRHRVDRVAIGAVPVTVGATVATLFVDPLSVWQILVWIATLLALLLGVRGFVRAENGYLTSARSQRGSQR